jgi:UDP-N-acetylmuramoylalanine--D-glutamate ligase
MKGNEQQQAFDSIVVGLGLTGLSCARYLVSRGERIAVADTRDEPPQLAALRESLPDVPVYLGDLSKAPLTVATRLVVSPGLSLRNRRLQKRQGLV